MLGACHKGAATHLLQVAALPDHRPHGMRKTRVSCELLLAWLLGANLRVKRQNLSVMMADVIESDLENSHIDSEWDSTESDKHRVL